MPLLIAEGIPAGVVNTLDRALLNEQAQARGMVLSLHTTDDSPRGKLQARVAGNPVKFVGATEAPPRFPPALGEHTEAVVGDWLREAAQAI